MSNFSYRYNPSLKPTAFEPGKAVYYTGFPPHAGWTYASTNCEACSTASVVSNSSKFCPACGSDKVTKQDDAETLSSLQTELTSSLHFTCCGCETTQAVAFNNLGNDIFCSNCGEKNHVNFKENAMKATAELLKVISDLRAKGQVALAEELENDMKEETVEDEKEAVGMNPDAKVAALDSGVDQKVPTGNVDEDKKDMIEEEKETPKPVEEQAEEDMEKCIAQAVVMSKHGVPAVIVKTTAGFKVIAEDEELPVEEEMVEEVQDDPKAVDADTADMIVAFNKRNGKNTKVTRVKNGFVLATVSDEELPVEEDAVKYEEMAFDSETDENSDEMKLQQNAEAEEPEILDEEAATKAVASLRAEGKTVKIVRVVKGFVVTAADESDLEEVVEEQAEEESFTGNAPVMADDTVDEEIEEVAKEVEEDKKDVLDTISNGDDEGAVVAEESEEVVDPAIDEKMIVDTEELAEEEKEIELETVADIDSLEVKSEDDVTMLLSELEDPFFTVLIKGEPVAKIALSAQPKPEQIRAHFVTEEYAMDVVDAMIKMGAKQTLINVNAKFYANEVKDFSTEVTKAEASVKDSLDKKYAEAVATVRDDLADCLVMEIAASNKNFYKDFKHILKAALFESVCAEFSELTENGSISEETLQQNVVAAIENGFNEGAAPFFGQLLDRAIAKLDMPKEAFAELKKAIGEADVQDLSYEDDQEESAEEEEMEEEGKPSFASFLSSRNVPIK